MCSCACVLATALAGPSTCGACSLSWQRGWRPWARSSASRTRCRAGKAGRVAPEPQLAGPAQPSRLGVRGASVLHPHTLMPSSLLLPPRPFAWRQCRGRASRASGRRSWRELARRTRRRRRFCCGSGRRLLWGLLRRRGRRPGLSLPPGLAQVDLDLPRRDALVTEGTSVRTRERVSACTPSTA